MRRRQRATATEATRGAGVFQVHGELGNTRQITPRRAGYSGGRFVWNAFVFNPTIAAANDGKWDEHAGIKHRVDHIPADNRIDITLAAGGTVSLWWATRSEWEGLLDVSGLETEALYGDFDRTPFDESSGEFVWVARKPG